MYSVHLLFAGLTDNVNNVTCARIKATTRSIFYIHWSHWFCRERSGADLPLASQSRHEKSEAPRSPPAARLPRDCGLLFHRFLLLLLVALPPVLLLFFCRLLRQPTLPIPRQVSANRLGCGPGPARERAFPVGQPASRLQPPERPGGHV